MTDTLTPRLPGQRTAATRSVLAALAKLDEGEWTFGKEIAEQIGLPPTSVKTILSRMAVAGWCEGVWESDEAARVRATEDGRSGQHIAKRRYYRLTKLGRTGVNGEEVRAWLDKS